MNPDLLQFIVNTEMAVLAIYEARLRFAEGEKQAWLQQMYVLQKQRVAESKARLAAANGSGRDAVIENLPAMPALVRIQGKADVIGRVAEMLASDNGAQVLNVYGRDASLVAIEAARRVLSEGRYRLAIHVPVCSRDGSGALEFAVFSPGIRMRIASLVPGMVEARAEDSWAGIRAGLAESALVLILEGTDALPPQVEQGLYAEIEMLPEPTRVILVTHDACQGQEVQVCAD